MNVTAYSIAQRFVGTKEVPGKEDNPQVLAMLRLDGVWPEHDEVPWCSAFTNYIAWLLRLPRSKSLAARSWLRVGIPVLWTQARVGFDVVVLSRGVQPLGQDIFTGPGHVGFFAGTDGNQVLLLGGNQSGEVSLVSYQTDRILGVRRLLEER